MTLQEDYDGNFWRDLCDDARASSAYNGININSFSDYATWRKLPGLSVLQFQQQSPGFLGKYVSSDQARAEYNVWLLGVYVVAILVSSQPLKSDVETLDQLIECWCNGMVHYYGHYFIKPKFHLLAHATEDIRVHGTLTVACSLVHEAGVKVVREQFRNSNHVAIAKSLMQREWCQRIDTLLLQVTGRLNVPPSFIGEEVETISCRSVSEYTDSVRIVRYSKVLTRVGVIRPDNFLAFSYAHGLEFCQVLAIYGEVDDHSVFVMEVQEFVKTRVQFPMWRIQNARRSTFIASCDVRCVVHVHPTSDETVFLVTRHLN